jgi:uncharacterized protein YuzE
MCLRTSRRADVENVAMRLTIDEEVDMAYLYLDDPRPGVTTHSIEFDHPDVQGSIYLDFDSSWRLRGLEIFRPSLVLTTAALHAAAVRRDVARPWETFGDTHATFMESCLTQFAFLRDDYACALSGKYESETSAEIRFANATTGVIVAWDESDHSLWLYISREDGTSLKWRQLSDLVRATDPDWSPAKGRIATVRNQADIVDAVTACASALRHHGDAVLRGDFSMFSDPPAS